MWRGASAAAAGLVLLAVSTTQGAATRALTGEELCYLAKSNDLPQTQEATNDTRLCCCLGSACKPPSLAHAHITGKQCPATRSLERGCKRHGEACASGPGRAGGSKVFSRPELQPTWPRRGFPKGALARTALPGDLPQCGHGPGRVHLAQQTPTLGHGPPVQPSPNSPPEGAPLLSSPP